VGDLLIKWVTG